MWRRVHVQGSNPNRAEANAAPTSSIDLVKVTPQNHSNRFPNPGKGWMIEGCAASWFRGIMLDCEVLAGRFVFPWGGLRAEDAGSD